MIARESSTVARASAILIALSVVLSGCSKPSSGTDDSTTESEPKTSFISIGTGGVTGVYYQVGSAIAKLVNAEQKRHGIKVSFQATGGSVYNINALMSGAIEIGIAQSDRQYQAMNGLGAWEDKPQTKLRAVCSMHPEAVTLVAAVDSGIVSLSDCKGKRVNIGNPGSGQRGNALDVLQTAGLDPENDLHAESLKAAEAPKVLQDGKIDAFFYTVGHPAGTITEATAGRRQVRFVPITGMDKLLASSPYYATATIRKALYPKAANTDDTETIGVMTTVVTSSDVPEKVIYEITKVLFENLPEVQQMHPAFADLNAQQMVKNGISAPYHPGALKYYREAGLLE